MDEQPSYAEHLDILIALVTYLALTDDRSRTVPNLADALSLPAAEVRAAFEAFPGLFRKSRRLDARNEHYYTLHARYALRNVADPAGALPAMRPDLLTTLLDFVTGRAAAELSASQFERSLRQSRNAARLATVAAAVATAATVVVAFLGGA